MHKIKLATLLINLTCSASLFAAGGINSGFSGSGGINQGPATSNAVASAGAAMLGGTNNFTGPNSFTPQVGGNLVLQPQINSGVNGFDWTVSDFTNIIDGSGFGLSNYNTSFYFNTNQAYVDDNGTTFIGCYTNSNHRYIMLDAISGIIAIGFNTNLTGFQADFTIESPAVFDFSSITNISQTINSSSSSIFSGTNTATAGTLIFIINQTNGTLNLSPKIIANITSTNGSSVIPSSESLLPVWMWNAYSSDAGQVAMSESTLTNTVNYYVSTGLDPYIDGYMLDGGMWGPNDSNGNFSYITNNWLSLGGLLGAANWVHSNTVSKVFWLWGGVESLSNGNNPTLYDMTNIIVNWNADGFSMDSTSTVLNNGDVWQSAGETELNNIRRIAFSAGKKFQIHWNANQTITPQWSIGQAIVNADAGEVGTSQDCSSYFSCIKCIHDSAPLLPSFPAGHYPQAPLVGMMNGDTNKLQSLLLMFQGIGPFCGFYNQTNFGSSGALSVLTNNDIHNIFKDTLLTKGFLVSSNGQDELWTRRLSQNQCLVVWWNTSTLTTNLSKTLTWNPIVAGYSPNQEFIAKRIFLNTNFTFTGSYTVSSIGTNSAVGFLLTPINSSAVSLSTLSVSNSWSVSAAITNTMPNFSTAFHVSSNGTPVDIFMSNSVPFIYYETSASTGILP